MIRTLVYADAHCEDEDMDRFKYLGEKIIELRPDHIVDLGDFVSLSSISHWDMSKRLKMEGERYKYDVECGRKAYDEIFRPLERVQNTSRQHKTKMYRPTFDKINGNHEDWVCRYAEQNPSLQGFMDIDKDLGLDNKEVTCYDYRERLVRHGVSYMHAPLAGNNQPISGLHVAHKTLQRFNGHVVFGHYHRYEVGSAKRVDAEGIHKAISCPAFFMGQPHYLSPNAPAVVDRGFLIITQDERDSFIPRVREVGLYV